MPVTITPTLEQAQGRRRCFSAIWILVAIAAIGFLALTFGLLCALTEGICRPQSPAPFTAPNATTTRNADDLHRVGRLSEGFVFNGTDIVNVTYENVAHEEICLESWCLTSNASMYNDVSNTCVCFDQVDCVEPALDDPDATFDDLHNTFLYIRGEFSCGRDGRIRLRCGQVLRDVHLQRGGLGDTRSSNILASKLEMWLWSTSNNFKNLGVSKRNLGWYTVCALHTLRTSTAFRLHSPL